ncbi:hypothetical protein PBY51_004650 [Eleginops maclovinus]|uniref:Uncharacterized protein n=1 Tax=Eleginops maclovinus TaxID=56733 RepID=A0AAN7Y3N3_ELEMC|nr:hypothetical protein PBY51_004650 [Eleginops maclovinus]
MGSCGIRSAERQLERLLSYSSLCVCLPLPVSVCSCLSSQLAVRQAVRQHPLLAGSPQHSIRVLIHLLQSVQT